MGKKYNLKYNKVVFEEMCLLVAFIIETLFALFMKSLSYYSDELRTLYWIVIMAHNYIAVYYGIYLMTTFKVKNKVLKIFDGILCIFVGLNILSPFKVLFIRKISIGYYIASVFFLLMPIIICLFEKLKINIDIFLRILVRIFMVLALALLMLAMPACNIIY